MPPPGPVLHDALALRPSRGAAHGFTHGAYCLGCCSVLMLLLFAVGVMNLAWVVLIAAFVLLEKLLPSGRLVARIAGGALIILGLALLARAGA